MSCYARICVVVSMNCVLLKPGDRQRERGQATLLLLGVVAALLAGMLVLFGFGQALGARSKH